VGDLLPVRRANPYRQYMRPAWPVSPSNPRPSSCMWATVPIRALGHYTDGIATWSEPLDNPSVTTDDNKIAHCDGGVVIAKQCGDTMLRIERDGRYASAVVHIAAHPRGTLTDFLTGLPSIVGLAWTADGLVISARNRDLWRVGKREVHPRPRYSASATCPWRNRQHSRFDGRRLSGEARRTR
jgi:hypothetical protein